MILGQDNQQPKIEYPCEWIYKVIGSDVNKMLSVIEEASMGIQYDVSASNVSRNGKYFSLNFKLEVPSELVRNLIFERLEKSPDIKFIL